MNFIEWLQLGKENGFCSEITCYTHDTPAMSQEEEEDFDEGFDPCLFIVRVYTDGRPDSE